MICLQFIFQGNNERDHFPCEPKNYPMQTLFDRSDQWNVQPSGCMPTTTLLIVNWINLICFICLPRPDRAAPHPHQPSIHPSVCPSGPGSMTIAFVRSRHQRRSSSTIFNVLSAGRINYLHNNWIEYANYREALPKGQSTRFGCRLMRYDIE